MYLDNKSKFWTYFNSLRISQTKEILQKYDSYGSVIEFGAYDLFFITQVSDFLKAKGNRRYYFTDIFTDEEIFEFAKHNLPIIQKNNPEIDFKLVQSFGENINENLQETFDSVFIFETLEHVDDEAKTIKNIKGLLNDNGYVFVGAPVEFGLFFLLKDLGRLLILGEANHSFKEMFLATIGKMDKVKRVKGFHQGYDYRQTIKLFEKEAMKLVEKVYYPNNFLRYGVLLVFQK